MLRALALVAACVVVACSSAVPPSGDTARIHPVAAQTAAARKAGDVSLMLTQDAELRAAETGKFSKGRLLATLRRALERNDVLTHDADPGLPRIEVTISDVHTRANSIAIAFGPEGDDDYLEGQVTVRSPTGATLQQFSVSASYAIGAGFIARRDDPPMDWLYESFARRVLDVLKPRGAQSR
jgi:hypothetical protein